MLPKFKILYITFLKMYPKEMKMYVRKTCTQVCGALPLIVLKLRKNRDVPP
jgi:hypothetical protein